jgi:hypothetical protein
MYSNESKSQNHDNLWREWSSSLEGRISRAARVASNAASNAGKVKVTEPGGLSVFSDIDLFGFEKKSEGPSNDHR